METPPAQTLNLLDLVAYQPGAVVSRVILKQKSGNVSLFAFAAGQELSEHTAPFAALVQVLEGTVDITIAGQVHPTQAGEIILMPAHQPHALKAQTPMKMVLTMLRDQA